MHHSGEERKKESEGEERRVRQAAAVLEILGRVGDACGNEHRPVL